MCNNNLKIISNITVFILIQFLSNITFSKNHTSASLVKEAIFEPTNDTLGSPLSEYGTSVDIYKNYAVVGAPETKPKGVAYVFKLNGARWERIATLQSDDVEPNDKFGTSVNIYNNRIVIGAQGARLLPLYHVGAVYVFELTNNQWLQTAEIKPNDLNYSLFGYSTDLFEDRIIVGSYGNDNPQAEYSGATYIFDYINGSWTQSSKIVPDDITEGDRFGYSVSLYKNKALIGSTYNGEPNNRHGSAYLFALQNDKWIQIKKLKANDAIANNQFGLSVSLYKNSVLVGSATKYSDKSGFGAVYNFEYINNSWVQKQKITVPNGESFGNSLDQSDLYFVVGNHRKSDLDNGITGSAFVFEKIKGMWEETQEILPQTLSPNSDFGSSVSIYKDSILIGDILFSAHLAFDNFSSGTSYFFKKLNNTWVQAKQFTPSDGVASDSFGNAVNLSNNRAAVSAVNDVSKNSNGTVYIFDYINGFWNTTTKIKPTKTKLYDEFGSSLSISNDRLLVGAPGVDDVGESNGAAYIFELISGKWIEVTTLYPDSLGEKERFGTSVSLVGNTALIGAIGNDEKNPNSGSVYIYNFDGVIWKLTTKLFASDSDSEDLFGYRVKLSGENRALISAVLDDEGALDSGAAYVFDLANGSWNQSVKLLANEPQEQQYFSYSLDIDNDVLVIGSLGYDSSNENAGTVYAYNLKNNLWNLSGQLLGEDSETELFGQAVSVNNNKIYAKNRFNTTRIFKFENNLWNESDKINTVNSYYGNNISAYGDRILIGADGSNQTYENSGRAFIYNANKNNFTLGGIVSGLTFGNAFNIKLNSNIELKYINTNGAFTFDNKLINNAGYHIEMYNQPSEPLQNCKIQNQTGIITNSNVQNVIIKCIVVNIFSNNFEN